MSESSPSSQPEMRQYLALLHKRRALVITCVGVSLLMATIYNYTTRPLYQATAQIQIDRSTPSVLPGKELVEMGGSDYQTEYQLLRARGLVEKVVNKLDLQKSLEFQTGPLMTPWERFERRFLGKTPAAPVDADGMPLSPAVNAFKSRLAVEPVPGTRLVNLRFTAYDPKVAADSVNTLAQLYIEQTLDYRHSTTSEATGWLSDRLNEQQQKVKEAEQALLQYREKEGLVGDQGLDQKLGTLNGAIMNARTQRIEKEALLAQLKSLTPAQLETYPLVMNNPLIGGLKARLADLQQQRTRFSETLGEKHPDMVRVQSEIKATQEKIQTEIPNILQSVESDIQMAKQQETSLLATLGSMKQETQENSRGLIELSVLKRDVETSQQLFNSLMQRTKETGLQTELKSTNVRIVEKAEVPRGPFSPQRTRNYEIAFLLGLALGIGLSVLFEQLDNTVKTPDDVKDHLGLPFLGMVPQVEGRAGSGATLKMATLIIENPQSAVAEAYRLLRTNLIFSSAETKGRAIVVSSPGPGEGKTTTVANVAASLAQNGAKVLAVDGDLRRPTLHQHFQVHKTPGLSDLIVGKCQASEAVQVTRFKGLHVLPCGYVPPNPVELLGSASMGEVVRALRAHYDWVLIDTAPILAMADTPVICPFTDGLVLVVGAEVTSRLAVQRAVDQIRSVGGKVLGVVLNRVNMERNSYYYGQYYAEYYRGYYAEAAKRREGTAAAATPRTARRA